MHDINELTPDKQLDFWLGEWDVTWGNGQRGTNHIQRVLDGRVIQEDFDGRPSMDFRGHSISVYSPQFGEWQQTWVDNEGNYWHLHGGWHDDRFILIADDIREGRAVKYRMVFHNIAYDSFEWNWELSEDNGETWTLRWQIHYERKAGSSI
jgi:hypothetical protein